VFTRVSAPSRNFLAAPPGIKLTQNLRRGLNEVQSPDRGRALFRHPAILAVVLSRINRPNPSTLLREKKLKNILAGVLLGSLFLASCGGKSSSPTLSGTWQLTAVSTTFVLTVTGNGTIQQNGSSVTGQLTLSGTPCATTAALSGNISGTTVTLQLQENGQAVNLTGTANANFSSLSGNYTAPSGGCTNGDSGTWSATKTS